MFIILNNYKRAFKRPRFPALDLDAVRKSPHVKHLCVDALEFTARDLGYIMHKFTGLTKLAIEGTRYEDGEAVDRMMADGLLSPQVYLDAFKWVISIKSFEIAKLSLVANVRESLEFWAKRPQLKAMDISGSSVDSREGIHFTIMNTDGEVEYNETEFEHKEKGAWEMKLDLHYHDFAAFYEQTLEQSKGNTIEHISLHLHLDNDPLLEPAEVERGEIVGKSLSYIMDHYSAVKEIKLGQIRLLTFHAETVRKLSKILKFWLCWIKPEALLQLSSNVSYIEELVLDRVTLLNSNADDDYFIIDMPQTSFGELAVGHDNHKAFLAKVCRSYPTQTTQYYIVDEESSVEVEEYYYNELLSLEGYHLRYNVVVVRCVDLKTLTLASHEYGSSFDIVCSE